MVILVGIILMILCWSAWHNEDGSFNDKGYKVTSIIVLVFMAVLLLVAQYFYG